MEDAAEAHGAEYKGKKAGSFGDISCFSFYGNKIITTGEGGMCLTNDKELEEKIRILKDHGANPNKTYWYDVIGFNYRMTNIQAAIGLAQLKKIDGFIKKKRRNARVYEEGLKKLVEKGKIELQPEMPWAKSAYWMNSILIKDKFGMSRDEVIKKIGKNGIESRPFFYPINHFPSYKNNEFFPVAEKLAREGINLPSAVTLSEDEIQFVADTLSSLAK